MFDNTMSDITKVVPIASIVIRAEILEYRLKNGRIIKPFTTNAARGKSKMSHIVVSVVMD